MVNVPKKPVVNPTTLMLGRLNPHKDIKNTPNLMKLKLAQSNAPAVLNRLKFNPKIEMYDNDRIGNCTAVGLANYIHGYCSLSGYDVPIETNSVVNFYSLVTGYTPSNPATDTGAVETDVLTYCLRNGFKTPGDTFYPLWGSVDPLNRQAVANVMYRLGAVYGGFMLSAADSRALQMGLPWDTNYPASFGDPTPGSWGGHCAILWDYTGQGDTDLTRIMTWGGYQSATRRWLDKHMEEAHGLMFRQLIGADGVDHLGSDWEDLRNQVATFMQSN